MWKYIVVYLLLKTVPCVDEFGREGGITFQTCRDTIQKQKVFDSRDEANGFIKRGMDEFDLRDFKLDSIPAIQYNCTHPYGSSTAMGCIGGPCNTFTCGRCGKRWLIN